MTRGYILDQWCLASDVMLPKKLNNCRINSLQCIHLMEADLNQILKHIARVTMREMERIESFSDMQFGFRTRRTTYQAVMSINTMIDHTHQAKVVFAILDTDCNSAFNCCIPEIIQLCLLSKGMLDNIATFLHNHLTKTEFNVIAGGFTSENRYKGGSTSFGSGQRGGAYRFHWIINQDITNKALEAAETQECVIRHPITGEVQTNNGIAFADDLTQISMSSIEQRPSITNISTLQKSVQLANNCLRAIEGSFSIPKCSFCHIAITKKGTLQDVPYSQFTIQPTPT